MIKQFVFNCNETGLFLRALPDKCFALKGSKYKRGRLAKDRFTVVVACSMTCEKAARSRCFRKLDLKNSSYFMNE